MTNEIIDGLAELGFDAAEVLAPVPIVLAVPGAAERLRHAGLAVRRLVFLGSCSCRRSPLASTQWRKRHFHGA